MNTLFIVNERSLKILKWGIILNDLMILAIKIHWILIVQSDFMPVSYTHLDVYKRQIDMT